MKNKLSWRQYKFTKGYKMSKQMVAFSLKAAIVNLIIDLMPCAVKISNI